MTSRTILVTAPCGCQVYEDHSGIVTWGVERCEEHARTETLPAEAEEYFES